MSGAVLKPIRPAKLATVPAVLSARERRAYQAAHRIFALTEYGERALACPGARRTRHIDRIAAVILSIFDR